MTYDEQTALRLVRSAVNDGASVYCHPLRRDILRRLVSLAEDQSREIAMLKQKVPTPLFQQEQVHA